jgi:hypothetical protein
VDERPYRRTPFITRTKGVLFRGTTLLGSHAAHSAPITGNPGLAYPVLPGPSASQLPGDIRRMAAVGGLQPVTPLSAGQSRSPGPVRLLLLFFAFANMQEDTSISPPELLLVGEIIPQFCESVK